MTKCLVDDATINDNHWIVVYEHNGQCRHNDPNHWSNNVDDNHDVRFYTSPKHRFPFPREDKLLVKWVKYFVTSVGKMTIIPSPPSYRLRLNITWIFDPAYSLDDGPPVAKIDVIHTHTNLAVVTNHVVFVCERIIGHNRIMDYLHMFNQEPAAGIPTLRPSPPIKHFHLISYCNHRAPFSDPQWTFKLEMVLDDMAKNVDGVY